MYEKRRINASLCIIALMLVLLSCSRQTQRDFTSTDFLPPGSIKLNDTVFIDQYEVSNITYREFLFSMKNIFGPKSALYLTMIPDTKVWSKIGHIECDGEEIDLNPATMDMLESSYHRSYIFDDFPVVGISFQQAKNFCTWRTNAVNAYLLEKDGHLKKETRFDFSLQDYLNVMLMQGKIDSFQRYPVYLLPTSDILEELEYLDDFNSRSNRVICDALSDDDHSFFMLKKNENYNKFGAIVNLSGNLAEMASEEGIAYGGSWLHDEDECRISKKQTYNEPSAWLGYRCAVVMMTFQQIQKYYNESTFPEGELISKF
jgi:hypothetical protein